MSLTAYRGILVVGACVTAIIGFFAVASVENNYAQYNKTYQQFVQNEPSPAQQAYDGYLEYSKYPPYSRLPSGEEDCFTPSSCIRGDNNKFVPQATLTGAFREAFVNGSLIVYAGAQVTAPGRYTFIAQAYSADGKPLVYLDDQLIFNSPTTTEISFDIFGKIIRDANAQSPFMLKGFQIVQAAPAPDFGYGHVFQQQTYITQQYPLASFSPNVWDSPDKQKRLQELQDEIKRTAL